MLLFSRVHLINMQITPKEINLSNMKNVSAGRFVNVQFVHFKVANIVVTEFTGVLAALGRRYVI